MNAQASTFGIAAAMLAVAAASLTGFGLRRQRYRGWLMWAVSMWLTTAGALIGAVSRDGSVAHAVAALLMMQWPVLALIGLRHFHARHALPLNQHADWGLLVVAALVTLGAAAWQEPVAGWAAAACAMALHLYAAVLLFRGPSGREGAPLQALGLTLALVALTPAYALLFTADTGASAASAAPPLVPFAPLAPRALAAALGSIVMAFVALMLVCERSERQLRDSRRRLRALANMDALTQVPNRRHFHELAMLALRTDPAGSAALMMFDIDHFKRINDHLGHAAGDRALTVVSGSVLEHLRSHDVAGRQGGDEFALLLRRADSDAALAVADRIVAEVQRRAPGQQLPRLSLSFGIVQVAGGERIDDALRRADQALYEAKRQGRSCAVAADGDEDNPVFSTSQRLGLDPLNERLAAI